MNTNIHSHWALCIFWTFYRSNLYFYLISNPCFATSLSVCVRRVVLISDSQFLRSNYPGAQTVISNSLYIKKSKNNLCLYTDVYFICIFGNIFFSFFCVFSLSLYLLFLRRILLPTWTDTPYSKVNTRGACLFS